MFIWSQQFVHVSHCHGCFVFNLRHSTTWYLLHGAKVISELLNFIVSVRLLLRTARVPKYVLIVNSYLLFLIRIRLERDRGTRALRILLAKILVNLGHSIGVLFCLNQWLMGSLDHARIKLARLQLETRLDLIVDNLSLNGAQLLGLQANKLCLGIWLHLFELLKIKLLVE